MTAKFERPENTEWMRLAACQEKDVDPEIFFPTHDASPSLSQARRVCAACWVKADCLAYALEIEGGQPAKTRDGVYAGTTGGERYRLYQRAVAQAARRRAAASKAAA